MKRIRSLAQASTAAWRETKELVSVPRWQLWTIVLLSAAVGLADIVFLGITATVGVALAGDGEGSIRLPFGRIEGLSIPTLIFIGITAAIITLVAQLASVVLLSRVYTRTVRTLRIDTYRDFVNTSWAVQRGEVQGVFLGYVVNYIPRVANVVNAVITELTAIVSLLVFLVGSVLIAPLIAAIVIILGAFLFAVFLPARGMARKAGQEAVAATRVLYGSFSDAVSASREVKAYGVEAPMRERIDGEIAALESPAYRSRLLAGIVPAVYLRAVFMLLLVGLGLIYALDVKEVGSIGAALLLVLRGLQQGQVLQSSEQGIAESRPFIKELIEKREHFRAHVMQTGDQVLERVDELRFEHISYRYSDGTLALDNVSFTANRGELIGLIGPSGSGKSTLSEIAVRLDTPTSGAYLINGRSVMEYDHASWTDQVVLVPQMSNLLAASIEENIRFLRPEIPDADVHAAALRAHLTGDVEDMEAGFDTEVGERGRRGLSGGQRQRLSIARAVAGRPSLVVLDEPTSALDHRAEEVIVQTIEELRQHACVLVIAHRISTLRHCDRVLVLRDGKREAFCTLDELPEQSPFFRAAGTAGEF